MIVAVDLLWVRHGISGGTESMIRNLMHGFGQFAKEDIFFFLVAKDNAETFKDYEKYDNFNYFVCNTLSASRWKRALWQRTCVNAIIKKIEADVYLSPIYSIPGKLSIPIVAVIHDLQALHFPEYFSKLRNRYMYMSWKETCKKADRVITISEYCRKDIIENMGIEPDRITVVYDPVIPSEEPVPFSVVGDKFGIYEGDYYYTVSSLAKHKNMLTLLMAFKNIAEKDKKSKLVITGIKVNAANEIVQFVKDNYLEKQVVFTGFISNEERDALYKGCKAFLYPSIFEGFGMPPIEAMRYGVPVIVSDSTSLKEVTQNKAIYVEEPTNADEWASKIVSVESSRYKNYACVFKEYGLETVTNRYIEVLRDVVKV